MTTEQLKRWVDNLPFEDFVQLVLFYSRLCSVCAELDKEKKI